MSKLTKALTAAAGNAGEALYVEDVFSTYLYEGASASKTITNDIDLSGEGGLIWTKRRDGTARTHILVDTERGAGKVLNTDGAYAEYTMTNMPSSFNSDGYAIGTTDAGVNDSSYNYASWTFRKAEKFFDVVTYTGNGTAGRTVAHNLGSVPAVMIVKSTTNGAYNWMVYHQSLGNTNYLRLNETTQTLATAGAWNNTTPTDSEFTLGGSSVTNGNGESFVAYLFASDAGGFGDDGSENIIKCGSYTGNGSTDGPEIDCGFEPQWLLIKVASGTTDNWAIFDTMRGIVTGGDDKRLFANLSNAELTGDYIEVNATGFKPTLGADLVNRNTSDYIYIAIRRPMKTPESGTEIYQAGTRQSTSPGFVSDFPVDMFMRRYLSGAGYPDIGSRLQGARAMQTSETFAEGPDSGSTFDYMNGYYTSSSSDTNHFSWLFKRATGFFDVVAYTGNGASSQAMAHNLTVAPEFIIVKRRDGSSDWICQVPYTSSPQDYMIKLNTNEAAVNFDDAWRDTAPTATNFTVGSWSYVNTNGGTYIAYLFATLAGVSKVGSYTGTGSDLNVDCGFSAGARFILIKRTDSTGDWYVYDSERGIVAGNDPYLLLNSTAAEVTSTDYIDPLSSGFTVTSSAPAALNASGGTYIFLAIS